MLINALDDVAVAAVPYLSSIQVLAVVASTPSTVAGNTAQKPRSWLGLLPQKAGRRMLKEVADAK